jgi:hypothetical protein
MNKWFTTCTFTCTEQRCCTATSTIQGGAALWLERFMSSATHSAHGVPGCGCAYLQHDAILDEKPVQFIVQLAQLHQTLESPVVLALPELV